MTTQDDFRIGTPITLRGQPGERGVIVGGPRAGADGSSFDVMFESGRRSWVPEAQIETYAGETVSFVGYQRFLRDLAVLKLSAQLTDVLYSMGASRTRFLVYQFQPVLKFVQSFPHGVLIADEVGLGKTIEAGLILKELVARGSVRRVLVVCPANLREKWRSEMQQRFGFQFRFVSAAEMRSIRRDVQLGTWPDFFGIASLEGLRRDELREILQETGIQFDLVIIDEAHHMRNPATQSFELGEVLSDQADHVLLLSATPVQTGATDLLSLLKLVEPAHFRGSSAGDLDDLLEPNRYINKALLMLAEPAPQPNAIANELEKVLTTSMRSAFENNQLFLACTKRLRSAEQLTADLRAQIRRELQRLHTLAPYYTRTRKREVEDTARRRSRMINVQLSEAELSFYEAWVSYAASLAATRNPSAPVTWAISMRERQAASSLQAAVRALGELLAGDPVSDVDTTDPELAQSYLPVPSQARSPREAVQRAARELGDRDTKVDTLVALIQEMLAAKPNRKILVFTFFKGTLRHLRQKLGAAAIRSYSMSGDDTPENRADIVARFQEDRRASVLLSTEVGAEGLDFQFCDAVVNFDLPWNPMRVEQRIGRIDRFGQREPFVDVVSFFVDDTIDTVILERLYTRIRVFEESIGELEPILGPVIQQLQAEIFSARMNEEEKGRRADQAVERIEYLKVQYSEFEATRAELLGQGDIIRQQVEFAKETGRYIAAPEMKALVAEWLRHTGMSWDRIEETSRPGIWDLFLSGATVGSVQEWMVREGRYEPHAQKLLTRLNNDQHAWCTFDSEIAQQNDGIAFLDVAHPVIRVAFERAKSGRFDEPFQRIGCLRFARDSQLPGNLALFVYRLGLTGAEPTATLIPVAVDCDSGQVVDKAGELAFGTLTRGTDCPELAESLDGSDLRSFEDSAFKHADHRRAELQDWTSTTQGARLATRWAAIERGYSARISRKRDLLSRALDPRIRRLYEGEIRNLTSALEAKRLELDNTPEAVATLDLMAVAVMTAEDVSLAASPTVGQEGSTAAPATALGDDVRVAETATPISRQITPDTPFTNVLSVVQILREARGYLWWLDKFFERRALELIAEEVHRREVSEIHILSSNENVDERALRDFKRLRDELAKAGMQAEWRVNGLHEVHDRYILSRTQSYNVPPVRTLFSGGWSDIQPAVGRPPFERWWARAKNIFG